ncbi:hypothetical protein ACTFIU_001073 [Dictyostelium citrinum]
MISRLEGKNRILCGDVVSVDQYTVRGIRLAPNEVGGIGIVFIVSVFHTLGYRDYNGDPIPLKKEFEETMYRTKFKVGLRCDPSKNGFGWTVFALGRGPCRNMDKDIADMERKKKLKEEKERREREEKEKAEGNEKDNEKAEGNEKDNEKAEGNENENEKEKEEKEKEKKEKEEKEEKEKITSEKKN